jgi:hypothetical protein
MNADQERLPTMPKLAKIAAIESREDRVVRTQLNSLLAAYTHVIQRTLQLAGIRVQFGALASNPPRQAQSSASRVWLNLLASKNHQM